jgi:uncharacterized protein YxjI
MKLVMKEKKLSFRDKFTIWDGDGNDKYYVVGELLSIGKKLHISDVNGNEVASIQEKIISLKPKYHIYIDGEALGYIVKERTLLKPKYSVSGVDWKIKGDVSEHKYSIVKDKKTIATMKKKRFSLSNSYVLDIEEERNVLPALASVLAIDCVLAEENEKK